MTSLFKLSVTFCLFMGGTSVSQATMVDTLPAGINSPSLRMGWISGIDQKYDKQGKLYSLSDLNSFEFNADVLRSLSPQANTLISILDQFGNQQFGQNINYGVLRVDTKPEVQYTSPVYARGITNAWSVGVAIPIIKYKNNISITQTGSNLDYYRSQFSGRDPSLDAALNLDLVKEARGVLNNLGYQPIESKNQTFMGDIQLVSAYRFWDRPGQGLLYTASFNLPTGPKYNPDDLVALNSFGRTGVENKVTYSKMLGSYWELAPYVSHNYYFTDRVEMRVPVSESDVLPDQNSKETVSRQIGQTFTAGLETYYNLSDRWSFGLGYALADKKNDKYSGTQGRRYDLLEADTASNYQRVNGQIQYSTVASYMKKQSLIPFIVALNYVDTVAGKNIERRTLNELNLMMFF